MGDWCPHDDDPMTCPPCTRAADQGHGPAVPSPPRSLRTFPARWVGNCSRRQCGALILHGDPIATDPDGNGVLCEDCARETVE